MKVLFSSVLLLVGASALGSDILWLKLNENHTYSDISKNCRSVKPGGDLFFAAEHEDGKIQRATISNYPNVWPYIHIFKSYEFPPQEAASIELHKDPKGRFWLKRLPLYGVALRWSLYWGALHNSYCPLPQLLQTISPSFTSFEFETDGIDEGILIGYSQAGDFTGLRSDGKPYEVHLSLVQREYVP